MVGFLSAPFILTGQAFDPASLFGAGDVGDWWLGGTPYTTTGRTVVAGVGDTVASLTGTVNGNHLIQATAAREPTVAANNLLTLGGTHGLYVSSIAWASQVVTMVTAVTGPNADATQVLMETTASSTSNQNGVAQLNVFEGGNDFFARVSGTTGRRDESIAYASALSEIIFTEHRNDTASGDIRMWLGTAEQTLTPGVNTKTGTSNIATASLNFGARDAGGTISLGWTGTGAPVMMINRALTAGERGDIAAEVTRLTGIS